jgi:two-component system, sensor histidine kinase and response regulator
MRKLKDKRIFIVEDNSMNRVIYKMSLGLAGASLQFDQKGDGTIDQLAMFKPDLIILDLMLPRGNSGYDIFDQIRRLPECKDVPIVAISASDPATALLKCQDKGFAGFIAKPIEEELLQDQVLRLINGEPVWYMGERYGGEIGDH